MWRHLSRYGRSRMVVAMKEGREPGFCAGLDKQSRHEWSRMPIAAVVYIERMKICNS